MLIRISSRAFTTHQRSWVPSSICSPTLLATTRNRLTRARYALPATCVSFATLTTFVCPLLIQNLLYFPLPVTTSTTPARLPEASIYISQHYPEEYRQYLADLTEALDQRQYVQVAFMASDYLLNHGKRFLLRSGDHLTSPGRAYRTTTGSSSLPPPNLLLGQCNDIVGPLRSSFLTAASFPFGLHCRQRQAC
jgi:hypothetical protein